MEGKEKLPEAEDLGCLCGNLIRGILFIACPAPPISLCMSPSLSLFSANFRKNEYRIVVDNVIFYYFFFSPCGVLSNSQLWNFIR